MSNPRGCYLSLAFSIGSIGIVWSSLLSFSPSDRLSVQRGAFLLTLGFVYFISLTNFIKKFLLETSNGLKIRRKYSLQIPDVLEITNRLVSAVQAVFSSLAGVIVCQYSCAKSFLHTSHFLTEAYGYFATAYFLYDMWSMYTVHAATKAQKLMSNIKYVTGNRNKNNDKNSNENGESTTNSLYDNLNQNKKDDDGIYEPMDKQMIEFNSKMKTTATGFAKYLFKNPLMTIHHLYIGTFGLFVVAHLRGGLGDCIFSWIYIMEISTPFVSFRSVLSRMNLKSTKIYVLNGLMMIILFFIFRVLLLPYLMYLYSLSANLTIMQAFASLPTTCLISISILFLPQYYWFYIMLIGAYKVFVPKTTKSNTLIPNEKKSPESVDQPITTNLKEN